MKCLFISFAHFKFFLMSFENSVYMMNTSPLSYMCYQIFSPSVWLLVVLPCFHFLNNVLYNRSFRFDGVQFINFLMFFMLYLRTLTTPKSQRYLPTRAECSLTPEKSGQSGGQGWG